MSGTNRTNAQVFYASELTGDEFIILQANINMLVIVQMVIYPGCPGVPVDRPVIVATKDLPQM